ncbi:hypothetical protein XIS1_880002 [Xenorhabdus innexi]|uniref:Uncharacterized protein n=1 Tax=Xenorhabdus innexi TaxID=290109 RepID=A0A1N6N186_9GAMM|nr:hypothetical protein XIS1_880002 [Xenorhabdus innexi]
MTGLSAFSTAVQLEVHWVYKNDSLLKGRIYELPTALFHTGWTN